MSKLHAIARFRCVSLYRPRSTPLSESTLRACLIVASALALWSPPLTASTFDPAAGRYVLTALPDAEREAQRMDRMQLCDQQPAGRYVRKGETITITASAVPNGYDLEATVGFKPMWGSDLDQQEEPLDAGENRFVANQDGPLYFKYITPAGRIRATPEVRLQVTGGRPLPLYVDGSMSADDWAEELAAYAAAPFVQLLGAKAMITLPSAVYRRDPIDDPEASFATIDQMLDLENELAGFDGQTARDQPTPLRVHFLVDFRVSKKDAESFYMYATDQFVGMLPDNTSDLTDPAALRERWGIWHETGHTQQQNSWTWDALSEVNVNLYSLYVQEAFGEPSALAKSEDGEPTFFEQARDYLERGANDLLTEVEENDEGDGFFIRLVLFHQLQASYGWDLFKALNKHFRAHPLPDDASDQDKADALVVKLCELTGNDLRPFFERWGLGVSDAANVDIDDADYPLPEQDPAEIFE